MHHRERPGPRGLLFPRSYSRDQFTLAEEEAHEHEQEREAERAPADDPEEARRYLQRFLTMAIALVALATIAPATATAHHDRAADVAKMDAVVDAWFHGQPCAGGEGVVMDPNLPADRDGEARGLDWRWNGSEWELYRASCAQAIRPGLSLVRECIARWHERAHLIYAQVEHTGDLAYDHKGPAGCYWIDHKPPSRRAALMDAIRETLPEEYAPWRVVCGRNAKRMRCRAESPHAKHVRRFDASIDGTFRRSR